MPQQNCCGGSLTNFHFHVCPFPYTVIRRKFGHFPKQISFRSTVINDLPLSASNETFRQRISTCQCSCHISSYDSANASYNGAEMNFLDKKSHHKENNE